ncbi:unnamed protein product [Mytilus coruscus]|uniref:DUF7869 domain-containing protein n=1 Tax=Mytilus coruscus TaxID=42192 RepID=A0A6J8ECV9_MYTCO|nr:unnamed protein product [Mytilus coruscus]
MDDLEKLRLAMEKNNDIEIQKIREENMKEINVTEFYKNHHLDQSEIDSLSQALLPTDLDPVMANCFTIKTTGNGNCLYNSFSKLFTGNEDLADRIRLLSALELYQNRKLYANLTPFEEVARHPEIVNGNLEYLFTCLLQDQSLNIYDVAKNREDAITYEALQTCHAGNWAGMFNIMAIAMVFNILIYSVYPEACRGIRPILHRKIGPVSKTDSLHTLEVGIFWTRDRDLDSRRGSMFTPNHFVPLVISKLLVANNETEWEESRELESGESEDEGEDFVILKGAQKESSRKTNALDLGKIQEDLKEDCGCYRECNSQFLNTEIVYRWRLKYHSLPQGFQQQTKLLEMYRDSWSSDCHFVEGMFICRSNLDWLHGKLVKYYGDDHPVNGNIYLPPGMTLKDVYDRYRDKYKDSKPLKLARFYEIWRKHFNHVKHPKCSKMAKCVVCVFAAELLKSTVDPKTRETIRADFSEHLERPNVTSIIVDGMDQAKTHIPHFIDMPKNLEPKNLLQSHITGIIIHGKGTKIYLDVSQYPHDSNLTMHCLLNALYDDAEMVDDNGKRCLKKKIYDQLDNCSRENKNKYLLALLALLVKWKKTEEVYVNFLMVGHTHEDID